MKPGDFVFTLEHDDIFRVKEVIDGSAWLESHADGDYGWEDVSRLALVDPSTRIKEISREVNNLSSELEFLCS